MKSYMLSYDLNGLGKNYEGLFEAIKTISTCWCKPAKSTWVIKSDLPSSQAIYEKLSAQLDKDDYIIVAEITRDIFGCTSKEAADFLSKNFM